MSFDLKTMARFWSKVAVASDENCWEWQAALSNKGYGRFKIKGQLFSPHRVAYEMANGSIEKNDHQYHGKIVRHKCDNRLCCNPAHLMIGTQADNVHDMVRRNRCMPPNKISEDLKQKIAQSDLPSREAAKHFGVSRHSIMRIRGDGAYHACRNKRVYGDAKPHTPLIGGE